MPQCVIDFGGFLVKELVLIDEKTVIAQKIGLRFKSFYGKKRKIAYDKLVFAGDESFLCDYLLDAVDKSNAKFPVFKDISYISDGDLSDYRKNTLDGTNVAVKSFDAINNGLNGKPIIFFFVDCDDLVSKEETLLKLNKVLECMKNNTDARCVISVMLPAFESYPSEAVSLSEREFSFFLEKVCKRTPEIDYYFEVEKICRRNMRESQLNLSLLRFDNVVAPDKYHVHGFDIEKLVTEMAQSKKIVINDEDFKDVYSLSYVRDACIKIFVSSYSAVKGHTYNVVGDSFSLALFKETVYKAYPQYFAVEKSLSADVKRTYRVLNHLKFDALKIKAPFSLTTATKHIVSFITELDYDTSANVAFYTGRIEQIQALEIEMLKEIDRICVENGIKYFLAGGTLLGAVRTGHVIPWDDDLDIGMLREDYDKFREACKTQLSDKFSYSSPFNGSGSHYTTEKIRLNSTYFSTRYSSKNVYPDGVFVDILVYDQTSNNKFFQKLQTLILAILYDCIIVRWYNQPRKNFHYKLTKFLLPLLRMIPWGVYHGLFEFFSKIYKNKKDAEWLIDTVGKKLKDGPLPKKGLEDTVYVDFNGIKAPIPVDCTGYLNYAYGPDYMQMPNLSNRRCPHNFARIDLGKYIFDEKGETAFRDVDLRGELFESDEEI